MMKLVLNALGQNSRAAIVGCLGLSIAMLGGILSETSVQAATVKLKGVAPVAVPSLPNENPTCYVQLSSGRRLTLDSICGTNDPKPDRRRGRMELDRDGIPFLMKENYRAIQEANRKSQEAYERMEREMPFSDNVLRLQAQQRKLSEQYIKASNNTERGQISKQIESTMKEMQADPSYQKAYELMRKLK